MAENTDGDGVNYKTDPAIMFTDHEACWDLEFRGAVGETALHLCFLNNTLIHLEIAKILLDYYPKLALDVYEAEEYYGMSLTNRFVEFILY